MGECAAGGVFGEGEKGVEVERLVGVLAFVSLPLLFLFGLLLSASSLRFLDVSRHEAR